MTAELMEESDVIYVMTRAHRKQLAALSPDGVEKCVLLGDSEEIVDPVGQSEEAYKACADVIESHVRRIVSELVL
jgi:protein-tyrosine-phosphatase